MNLFNLRVLGLVFYLVILGSVGFYYQGLLTNDSAPIVVEGVESGPSDSDFLDVKLKGRGLTSKMTAYLTLDSTNPAALTNRLLVDGNVVDVEIVGQRLFVGKINAESEVFGLEDPQHPQKLKTLSGLSDVWSFKAEEDLIVYNVVQRGIFIYDQPNFSRRGYQPTRGESMATVRHQEYLYSAENRAGLSVYDMSNPEKLSLIGQLALEGNSTALAFSQDFLLVAARTGGLHLVDVHDPRHPRLVETLPAQRSYESVAVHQGIVYASDSFLQLDILQLEKEGALRRISSLPLLGSVRDMVFGPERLYLAESQNGVRSVDIRDPSAPQNLGSVMIAGDPRGLALAGDYLYVAAGNAGIQIVDSRKIQPRRFLGLANTPGRASHIVADGRWLYVADGFAGLVVLDRSRPPELLQVAQVPTDLDLLRLAQAGNYLYGVTRGKKLLVFDISQPQAPRLVHAQSMASAMYRLVVCGHSLLIATSEPELLRLDISTPDEPRLVETIPLAESVKQFAVKDTRVYIAAGRAGLLIAQVEEGRPLQLSTAVERFWPMSEFVLAFGVAVRGDSVYVSLGENGLQVLNVADPDKVRELLLLPLPGFVREVQLSEDFAVIADFEYGYNFVNIQQPQRPFLAAQMPAAFRQLAGFIVDKEQIYQPSRGSGVQTLPLPLALPQTREGSGNAANFHLGKRPEPGWYSLNLSDRGQFVSRPAAVALEKF